MTHNCNLLLPFKNKCSIWSFFISWKKAADGWSLGGCLYISWRHARGWSAHRGSCFGCGPHGWEKGPNSRNLLRTVTFWPACLFVPSASKKLRQYAALVVLLHPPPREPRTLASHSDALRNQLPVLPGRPLTMFLTLKFPSSLFTRRTAINKISHKAQYVALVHLSERGWKIYIKLYSILVHRFPCV